MIKPIDIKHLDPWILESLKLRAKHRWNGFSPKARIDHPEQFVEMEGCVGGKPQDPFFDILVFKVLRKRQIF